MLKISISVKITISVATPPNFENKNGIMIINKHSNKLIAHVKKISPRNGIVSFDSVCDYGRIVSGGGGGGGGGWVGGLNYYLDSIFKHAVRCPDNNYNHQHENKQKNNP